MGGAVKDVVGGIGGLLGGQSAPPAPPPAPEPQAPAPVNQNEQAQSAANEQRRRRRQSAGRQSTILTGAAGAEQTATGGKSLLGA